MEEIVMQDKKPYPNLAQSWALLGLIILVSLIIAVFFVIFNMILMLFKMENIGSAIVSSSFVKLVLYTVPFVLVFWFGIVKKRKSEKYQLPKNFVPLPLLLTITLITLLIYFLVDPIIDLIPMPRFFIKLIAELLGDKSLWAFIMLVFAAPICEEVIFRGIILDGLLKNYSPRKAIIWSALLFGIVHLNPWQFIAALSLGLFMGWVYYKTGSLLTTIFIHFIANFAGFIIGLFVVVDPENIVPTRVLIGNTPLYFALLGLDLILLIGSLLLLNKQFQPSQQ